MKPGKNRSNFGRWMDKQKDVKKVELKRASKLSSNTISKLCSDPEYHPIFFKLNKINQVFKKLGKNIDLNDFFC
jgi:hypothetical protein